MQMLNCFEVSSSELYMRNINLEFAFRQMENSSQLIQLHATVTGINRKPCLATHFYLRTCSDASSTFYSIQLLLTFTSLSYSTSLFCP